MLFERQIIGLVDHNIIEYDIWLKKKEIAFLVRVAKLLRLSIYVGYTV